MEKTYQPKNIEKHCYNTWEEKGYFKPTHQGKSYCIPLPPPNVTGTLHMGHGFQHTLMDALIRYQRMQGRRTLWQGGCDHAGIATQMVVERQLLQKNLNRHDLGREAFIEKIWEWKEKSGNTISNQMRRLGSSIDWSRERFTMEPKLSKTVIEAFERLYDEGLIYRGKRLVNWDPTLHTAISDLEVVQEEEQGSLWHITYPLSDGTGELTIATTRPETLLGDTAVAVHPDDERYQSLIGKTLSLPLTQRDIPIIADDYVDAEFGTGCVKITPAHDFNDYEIGKRHDLPFINILTPEATLNENTPEKYQGMDRFEARKAILADLEQQSLLVKTQPHLLKTPRGDRSGEILEPYLTDQWFVNVKPLAGPAIDAVKTGQIRFVPENWSNTFFSWMNNLQDWCISRQLWWGHRIPAWYDETGRVYVACDEASVRSKYNLSPDTVLKQDNDVLDTWFSSALWPFSTLDWLEDSQTFQDFYPAQVLVTGFDIIFFWVARMIMMGLKFTGNIPFHEVYITGLIRDQDGHKMSKSKGNVLDPLDLMDGIDLDTLCKKRTAALMQPNMKARVEKATRKQFPDGINAHGTDALRFTYCALAATGRDIRFDLGRLEGYRNFCNKLWNAARYVLMNTEDKPIAQGEPTLADAWILTKLQQTIDEAHQHFKQYRFDLLAQCLYDFTWNAYCDWYLELSKPILYDKNANEATKASTRFTLLTVLETLLRLLHPIMPFITEEIWQKLAPLLNINDESIMIAAYPKSNALLKNNSAHDDVEWLKSIIQALRNIRGEMNISPNKGLSLVLSGGNEQDQKCLQQTQHYLTNLAKLNNITWLNADATPPPSATALVGDLTLFIPLAEVIDKRAEITRLNKELDKLQKELQKSTTKLNNPNYVEKAPVAVVNKEKQRVMDMEKTQEKLNQQLERINAL